MSIMNLLNRAKKVLRNDGIIGLLISTSAYIHNKLLFKHRIRLWVNIHKLLCHKGLEQPFKPLRVDPSEITSVLSNEFNQKKKIGFVKSGSWDKKVRRIDEHPTYKGIKQRFQDNYDWEDTVYYKRSVKRIERGENVYGYSSVSKFEQRLQYLDSLYEDIKNNGYRSQRDLVDDDWDSNRHQIVTPAHRLTGEIGINIGRNGELIHNDGMHRLSIAKVLDLDEIPVQVIVRHQEWQRQRNKMLSNEMETARQNSVGSHPDIAQFASY